MKHQVTIKKHTIKGEIVLPASKSISNRLLIIRALCNQIQPVHNLSDSDDTKVLQKALTLKPGVIDIGHAGTAMRFLTALLSLLKGEWMLTGSDRMKLRPVGILVEALKQLGGHIEYVEHKGYPPLKIYGSRLAGKKLELDGSISSQYISALLMIAPSIENGLSIALTGEMTSRSYIEMTLKLMNRFGIKYVWEGDTITVEEQQYQLQEFTVEADWSAASYWYQILALADKGEILMKNLSLESVQGDARIATWFSRFGIQSEQSEAGVWIKKSRSLIPDNLLLDFIENPDMAQTMACLCVAQNVPFYFTGLKTLKIKETDRIAALRHELAKLGARLYEPEHGALAWNGFSGAERTKEKIEIKTYNDHRMALAFAPLALTGLTVEMDNPMVVTKSYPHFWEDLKKAGFQITPV